MYGFNEIVYSIFIGMISSKIAGKIDGIGLQCRRDTYDSGDTTTSTASGAKTEAFSDDL